VRATFLCLLALAGAAYAQDDFKRLSAAEIRARIVGHTVTDDVHWSDRFRPDGTVAAVQLGNAVPAEWKLQGNELCVTRKYKRGTESECVEVWLKGDAIEYRRDGVTVNWGFLRN
jgi:hypothetical protein